MAIPKSAFGYMQHFMNPGYMKEGHNTKHAPGMVATAKKELRTAKKTGGDVAAAKAGVKEAKGERREAYKTLHKAERQFAKKGVGGGRKAAIKSAKQDLSERFHGSWKATKAKRAAARKAKEDDGGFLGSVLGGAKKAAAPWT